MILLRAIPILEHESIRVVRGTIENIVRFQAPTSREAAQTKPLADNGKGSLLHRRRFVCIFDCAYPIIRVAALPSQVSFKHELIYKWLGYQAVVLVLS